MIYIPFNKNRWNRWTKNWNALNKATMAAVVATMVLFLMHFAPNKNLLSNYSLQPTHTLKWTHLQRWPKAMALAVTTTVCNGRHGNVFSSPFQLSNFCANIKSINENHCKSKMALGQKWPTTSLEGMQHLF